MSKGTFDWDARKNRENAEKHGVLFSDAQRAFADPKRRSFGYSALATGAKERASMSARIRYNDEPIGEPKVIWDFLPSPDELAFREEDVKITITLSKRSVDFFKGKAAQNDTQYQRMIRRLLDAYVEAHVDPLTGRSMRTVRKRAAG